MSELSITGGFMTLDPLRDHLLQAALPTESDPDVQPRCPAILKEALTLCCRFGEPDLTTATSTGTGLETPRLNYVIEEDGEVEASTLVWLHASLTSQANPERGIVAYDLEHALVVVRYQLGDKEHDLMRLRHNGLSVPTQGGIRYGDHGMLNYFQGIVEKVRTVAFPKNLKLEEEHKLDKAADTRNTASRRAVSAVGTVTVNVARDRL